MYTYEIEAVVLTWREGGGDGDELRKVERLPLTVTSFFEAFELYEQPADPDAPGGTPVLLDLTSTRLSLDGAEIGTDWPYTEVESTLAALSDGTDTVEVLTTDLDGDGGTYRTVVIGLAGADITGYASIAGIAELSGWDAVEPSTEAGFGTAIAYADLPNLVSERAAFVAGATGGDDDLRGTGRGETADLGAGNDTVDMGDGDDAALGGKGNDSILGGRGEDLLAGGAGSDLLVGGRDRDLLAGQSGRDTLAGGGGRDELFGGGGGDLLKGGGGTDMLMGDRGDDTLNGGGGSDFIEGGRGDDVMAGRGGADTFFFANARDRATDVITDFRDGTDVISFGRGSYEDVAISDHADGTLLTVGRQKIVLEGVGADRIDATDFLF